MEHPQKFGILGGPSKFDLTMAVCDRPKGRDRNVSFRLEVPPEHLIGSKRGSIECSISLLAQGRGEDEWAFLGSTYDLEIVDPSGGGGVPARQTFFKGHYSTSLRTGWIRTIKESKGNEWEVIAKILVLW